MDNDHAIIAPRGDFVVALRAEIVGFFEPVGEAGNAGQADTEKATEDTSNTVSRRASQRGRYEQTTTAT